MISALKKYNVANLKVGPAAAENIKEKDILKNETSYDTTYETRYETSLKPKEYERLKGVISKLISDELITIQEVMSITQKSRATAWRYMQKLVELDVVVVEGKTNNIKYRLKKNIH